MVHVSTPLLEFFNNLKCCPLCGFMFGWNGGFCASCQANLLAQFQFRPSLEYPWPVFFGWEWTDGQAGQQVGVAIKAMKGGWAKGLVDQLAIGFLARRMGLNLDGEITIVPAPAHELSKSDHAHEWGRALSKILGCKQLDILRRPPNQKKQGLRNAKERSEIHFETASKGSFSQQARIIFVDDLITSGSTARAAFEALGRPLHFEVWALACRPLKPLL